MKARGFTLIEVLIALTIIAIALTAAIFAVQSSVKTTDHISNKLMAHWVAMNVLSSMQVKLISPPIRETTSGEENILSHHFTWTAGVDQTANDYYERITVEVHAGESSEPLERLTGFVKVGN